MQDMNVDPGSPNEEPSYSRDVAALWAIGTNTTAVKAPSVPL